jgi:hypothetical protein
VLSGDTDKGAQIGEVGPQVISRPPDRPKEEVIPPASQPPAESSDPIVSSPAATSGAATSTGTEPATTPSIPLTEIQPAAGNTGSEPAVPPAPDTGAPAAPVARDDPSDIIEQPLPPVDGATVAPPEPPVANAPNGEPAQDGPRSLLPPDAPSAPTTPVSPAIGSLDAVVPDPVAPVEPEPEPVVAPPPPPPQRVVSGVRIQVASLRSQGAANTAWQRLVQRNRDVLGGLRSVITQAEVKGATYYRAQAEGFGSRAEAQATCAKLKSRGTDCLVVAR